MRRLSVLIYTFNNNYMLIKYKNYTIEDDRNGYILNIFGVVKDKESKNFGEWYLVDTFYPSTIESAIKRIVKNETSKKDIDSLESFLVKYKEVSQEVDDFISKIE